MLQLLKKLKLYIHKTTPPDTVHKVLISFYIKNLFLITCILPAPTKVFLQLENNTELILHL